MMIFINFGIDLLDPLFYLFDFFLLITFFVILIFKKWFDYIEVALRIIFISLAIV